MPKFRACTPSLTDPVVMVTGTEIADRPLRVRSGNSAGSRAGRIYFCFHSQGPTFNCVYIIPAIDDQSIVLGTTGRDIGILH